MVLHLYKDNNKKQKKIKINKALTETDSKNESKNNREEITLKDLYLCSSSSFTISVTCKCNQFQRNDKYRVIHLMMITRRL